MEMHGTPTRRGARVEGGGRRQLPRPQGGRRRHPVPPQQAQGLRCTLVPRRLGRNCFVVFGLVVRLPFCSRPVCLRCSARSGNRPPRWHRALAGRVDRLPLPRSAPQQARPTRRARATTRRGRPRIKGTHSPRRRVSWHSSSRPPHRDPIRDEHHRRDFLMTRRLSSLALPQAQGQPSSVIDDVVDELAAAQCTDEADLRMGRARAGGSRLLQSVARTAVFALCSQARPPRSVTGRTFDAAGFTIVTARSFASPRFDARILAGLWKTAKCWRSLAGRSRLLAVPVAPDASVSGWPSALWAGDGAGIQRMIAETIHPTGRDGDTPP